MKIWIDVTGLYNWGDNFTGIQRVVYNLSKKLTSSDLNSGLFVYNNGNYSELTFEQLEEHIKQLRYQKNKKHLKTRNSFGIRKLIYRSIVYCKRELSGTRLEPQLRRVYTELRKTYRNIIKTSQEVNRPSIFQKKDIVIIIDGNWQYPSFAKSIKREKKISGFVLIHMIHDLIAYINPALVNDNANQIIFSYLTEILGSVDEILVNSLSTKRDVDKFLANNNIDSNIKISRITLGSDFDSSSKLDLSRPKNFNDDNFILAVGTIEIRKNYMLFYYIYKLAAEKGLELPNLFIVGKRGWGINETYSLLNNDPLVNKKITFIQATDQELKWLYSNCKFTVFPSLYEGWGLPIAESLCFGKCCISSNTSSMPEVGGQLVQYASPYSPEDFLKKIELLSDVNTRKHLEKKIKDDYKQCTWDDTYIELEKILGEYEFGKYEN